MQGCALLNGLVLLLIWFNFTAASVLPNNPILKVGDTLNLTCTLENTLESAIPKLFEFLRPRTDEDVDLLLILPKTALLQIKNIQEEDTGEYECLYNDTLQGGQLVKVGYLDAPRITKCVFYNYEILTCGWDKVRDPLISTTWKACWKRRHDVNWSMCQQPDPSSSSCNWTTNPENGSGTLWINDMIWIQVQAQNALGVAPSEERLIYTNASLVEPAPINSTDIAYMYSYVSWRPPNFPPLPSPIMMDYQVNVSLESGQPVQSFMITAMSNESASVKLPALHLDVLAYTISIRSKPSGGGFWSKKSALQIGFTGTYGVPFHNIFAPVFCGFVLFLLGTIYMVHRCKRYVNKCLLIPIIVPKPVPDIQDYPSKVPTKCKENQEQGNTKRPGVITQGEPEDQEFEQSNSNLDTESTYSSASCTTDTVNVGSDDVIPPPYSQEGHIKPDRELSQTDSSFSQGPPDGYSKHGSCDSRFSQSPPYGYYKPGSCDSSSSQSPRNGYSKPDSCDSRFSQRPQEGYSKFARADSDVSHSPNGYVEFTDTTVTADKKLFENLPNTFSKFKILDNDSHKTRPFSASKKIGGSYDTDPNHDSKIPLLMSICKDGPAKEARISSNGYTDYIPWKTDYV